MKNICIENQNQSDEIYDLYINLRARLNGAEITDAHRHGLYDKLNIKQEKVERWKDIREFIEFQNRTKKMGREELEEHMSYWLEISKKENTAQVIDFSGKHASNVMKEIYSKYGIKYFEPVKWNKIISKKNKLNEVENKDFIILPDEMILTKEIMEECMDSLSYNPSIRFTMHCMESSEKTQNWYKRNGCTTVFWLNENGYLSNNIYLVHLNMISPEDEEIILDSNANVVICPSMNVPLKNKNPEFSKKFYEQANVYYGVDAPFVSKVRSLIYCAAIHARSLLDRKYNYEEVLKIVIKNLKRKL